MEHLALGEENDNNESFPCAKHTAVSGSSFDQIANHHYRPAFDEGMQQKRAEIAASRLTRKRLISTILFWHWNKAENYLPALPASFAMTAAHTNDELQRLDEQFSAELAELANDIYLNGELFARVDAVWQRRESLGLDSESRSAWWRLFINVLSLPEPNLRRLIKQN
ncbi:hypothetical protein ACVXG9_22715 [Escherichia coli]